MIACGRVLQLAGYLHTAGTDPVERKRRLLTGLCQLVSAQRATSVVTRTDLASGRQSILSALSVRMVNRPSTGAERHHRRGSGGPATPTGHKSRPRRTTQPSPDDINTAVDPDFVIESSTYADAMAAESAAETCLDDFAWLDGLKLAGCITFFRPRALPRFSPAHRAMVSLVHSRFTWVYAHDQHLARIHAESQSGDPLKADQTPFQLLRELVGGSDIETIIRRRRGNAAALRRSIAAELQRIGCDSREQLLERWAVPPATMS
ncbi:hypothetical protein [Humisphaera borealis]|uniref:Uncharacterized protein n=1 Tax=Humisphaera borealis TaxID=2807512 RepID=A0A7M2WYN0_9BACT|nr:hypothetical protein [Humisphaera borealis]QOV90513.1 hypothetical protein IPV69_03865 [Humisphaera borealis]